MLKLQNVVWNIPDGEQIIQDISYTAQQGRLVVITGPNGGGKTTLAKLIAGLEKPTSGKIYLNNEDITDCDITQRAKKGIAYAFQQPVRFKGITIQELLELAAGKELSYTELCDLLGKVGLCAREYINRELDSGLSGGEMKRVEIASVLARNAKVTIFDEPEAGIDLWSFARLTETFRELHEKGGRTILIISHQERIIRLADEIILIANGEIAGRGTADELYPKLLSQTVAGCNLLEVNGIC